MALVKVLFALRALVAEVRAVDNGTSLGDSTHNTVIVKHDPFLIRLLFANEDIFLEVDTNVVHLVIYRVV